MKNIDRRELFALAGGALLATSPLAALVTGSGGGPNTAQLAYPNLMGWIDEQKAAGYTQYRVALLDRGAPAQVAGSVARLLQGDGPRAAAEYGRLFGLAVERANLDVAMMIYNAETRSGCLLLPRDPAQLAQLAAKDAGGG